jgi:hypothetical protein
MFYNEINILFTEVSVKNKFFTKRILIRFANIEPAAQSLQVVKQRAWLLRWHINFSSLMMT